MHHDVTELAPRNAQSDLDQELVALGWALQRCGYQFTTVSPETHRRVLERPAGSDPLREVFGWSRWIEAAALPEDVRAPLAKSGRVERRGEKLQSLVRFSTLHGQLFAHSAFPTLGTDAVFFGPDTYRFAAAISRALRQLQPASLRSVVDVGCGSGAGGIHLAKLLGPSSRTEIILADINKSALGLSSCNAQLNGVRNVTTAYSDVLSGIPNGVDLVISNPPYLVDAKKRLYRDGGGDYGFDLSLRIVAEAIERLNKNGTLMLYTGTPVIEGRDLFRVALRPLLDQAHLDAEYEELDPDVFGEELDHPAYRKADRIAVIALTLHKS